MDWAQLLQEVSYDPTTGLFTRLKRYPKGPQKRYEPGCAGTHDSHGYIQIQVGGRLWRAHRLAFLLVEGRLPVAQIDHINGVRDDNRWVNLREATPSQNRMNESKRAGHTSKFKGVYFSSARGTWGAQIKANGVWLWLGSHASEDAAACAYAQAAKELHGDYARID